MDIQEAQVVLLLAQTATELRNTNGEAEIKKVHAHISTILANTTLATSGDTPTDLAGEIPERVADDADERPMTVEELKAHYTKEQLLDMLVSGVREETLTVAEVTRLAKALDLKRFGFYGI